MTEVKRPKRPERCPVCGDERVFVRITDETIIETERVYACYSKGHEIGETWLEPTTLALIEQERSAASRYFAKVFVIGVAAEAAAAAVVTILARIAALVAILLR